MNRNPLPSTDAVLSDEELDRDWKPSGRRPQSTIARSFSQELMDIFRIENSIADQAELVERRKQHISTQNNELEALEARIREMEERLKSQPPTAPAQTVPTVQTAQPHQRYRPSPGASSPRHARAPVSGAFADAAEPEQTQQSQSETVAAPAPLAKDYPPPLTHRSNKHGHGGRPPTATQRAAHHQQQQHHQHHQQMVGGPAMPPTPVGSEGEYDDASEEDEEHNHLGPASSTSTSTIATVTTTTRSVLLGENASADFVFVRRPDGDVDYEHQS